MATSARRLIRWGLLVLVFLFLAAQFVPLDRGNPPVDPLKTLAAVVEPPPVVEAALERSCRNCHSNQTDWPWYSRVAPVSWVIANDVEEGREHLNFSEWAFLDTRSRARRLEEICEEVEGGSMPEAKYVLFHPDARLSQAEISAICDWARGEVATLLAPPPSR